MSRIVRGVASIGWLLTLLVAASNFTPARAADATAYAIDVKHSRGQFSVRHLLVERVSGSVPIASGTVVFDGTLPSSIEATLDPSHVATDDPDRDSDLQGPDWFDTKRFPTWQFKSTRVRAGDAASFSVDGFLTVHGIARAVTLHVTTVRALPHPAYHAVTSVDRHAFGMSVTRMDPLIGSSVDLTLDVTLQ